jgi:histidine triad (HIT) family protein
MADEVEAARTAAAHHAKERAEAGEPTIFDKIVAKQIPATIVFEDDSVLAFRDISPQGPTHIVLIPKARDGLTQLSKADDRHEQILGHLMVTAAKVARQEGLDKGFRLVVNDGPQGSQSVYHLHLHLIGGRQMNWPPG